MIVKKDNQLKTTKDKNDLTVGKMSEQKMAKQKCENKAEVKKW